jgi:hypothetical protein
MRPTSPIHRRVATRLQAHVGGEPEGQPAAGGFHPHDDLVTCQERPGTVALRSRWWDRRSV